MEEKRSLRSETAKNKFETVDPVLIRDMLSLMFSHLRTQPARGYTTKDSEFAAALTHENIGLFADTLQKDLSSGEITPALTLGEIMLDLVENKTKNLEGGAQEKDVARLNQLKDRFGEFVQNLILRNLSLERHIKQKERRVFMFMDVKKWLRDFRDKVSNEKEDSEEIVEMVVRAIDNFLLGEASEKDANRIDKYFINPHLSYLSGSAARYLAHYLGGAKDAKPDMQKTLDEILRFRQFRSILEERAAGQKQFSED